MLDIIIVGLILTCSIILAKMLFKVFEHIQRKKRTVLISIIVVTFVLVSIFYFTRHGDLTFIKVFVKKNI